MRSPRRNIPSFSLYGEERPGPGLAQSTHIEDIPSRSRKYLGQIEAHRHHDLSQCVLVTSGPVTATLETLPRALSGPAAIIVPAGAVHSFRFAPDTSGFVLTVNLTRFVNDVGASHLAMINGLFAVPRILELGSQAPLWERVVSMLGCLLAEYRRAEQLPDAVAALLAGAVLSSVAEACKAARAGPNIAGPDLTHLREFRNLIELNYGRHWPVSRYARQLKTSETTLNRLCLRLTGHTAFNLIQQRLALEAQRRLIYSGATVSGIASELGFQDPAYFSRFFRRHIGISPTQFRHRRGDGKVPTPPRIVQ